MKITDVYKSLKRRKRKATKKCPYCAEEVKRDAKLCKHCKKKIPRTTKERVVSWSILGVGLLIALYIVFDPIGWCLELRITFTKSQRQKNSRKVSRSRAQNL